MTTSTLNKAGNKWREWILENIERNCSQDAMLKHMVPTFTQEQALMALSEARDLLTSPALNRPLINVTTNKIDLGDITAQVVFKLMNPHVVVIDNVLTATECDLLVQAAIAKNIAPSTVVHIESGESVLGDYRTSSGCCFSRSETELIKTMERRLSTLNQWPTDNGEGIQVLQYEVGQQYKPHFDYFNPKNPGSSIHLKRGGQRVGTFVVYLSDVDAGGSTAFPEVGVEVYPRKGSAVYFSSVDEAGKPCELTRHAGTPVIGGVKTVATYWQRERSYR